MNGHAVQRMKTFLINFKVKIEAKEVIYYYYNTVLLSYDHEFNSTSNQSLNHVITWAPPIENESITIES